MELGPVLVDSLKRSLIMVNKEKLTEQGFTLIEVMIAVSLLSIMSVALTSMISNQSNVIKQMELKLEKTILAEEITKAFSDKSQCSIMLSGKSLPLVNGYTNLASIALPGSLTLTTNTSPQGNALIVGDIKIKNVSTLTTPAGQALLKVLVPFYTMSGSSKTYYKTHEVEVAASVLAGTLTDCENSISCLDPDDGIYKEKRLTSEQTAQVCNDGAWITTMSGCSSGGNFYPTGHVRRSGGGFFRRSRKYVCVDGSWAYGGR